VIITSLTPASLLPATVRLFALAQQKIPALNSRWNPSDGTPVFTINGQYTTRGWTEWTQGFQYGSALLAFDATSEQALLDLGRKNTLVRMAPHITHTGVHDHAFNNLSTYGNLRRLMKEGRIPHNEWELHFYELALKASGAVQVARWSGTAPAANAATANATALGYIHSFNGPHSLFIDTIRTCRILGVAWQLGHKLMHEGDRSADLLKRSVLHGLCTNHHLIFHGGSGATYDCRGRTAHEGIFNRSDGSFRSRATQQGYSPFSTWSRGLAWSILGFAEELEFFATIPAEKFHASTGLQKADVLAAYLQAATDTADHYIHDVSAADGIPYWDDGAPNLHKLGDWQSRAADPFNDHEPVDSSAAAIAAQGLIRLGRYVADCGAHSMVLRTAQDHGTQRDHAIDAQEYINAGLTIAGTLFAEPYLSTAPTHEGLLLHSIYHHPNNWDHVPAGRKIPSGESSMWGDYHVLELALLISRLAGGKSLFFFDPASRSEPAGSGIG